MAQAEIKEVLSVNADKMYKAITQYDRYPQFVEGVTSAKVTRISDAEARVDYKLSMLKDISYALTHKENASARTMQWSLIQSDFMKKNNGSWTLREVSPDKTEVSYQVEVEFNFPVPGLILNKLIKGQLPKMLKNFEACAKTL